MFRAGLVAVVLLLAACQTLDAGSDGSTAPAGDADAPQASGEIAPATEAPTAAAGPLAGLPLPPPAPNRATAPAPSATSARIPRAPARLSAEQIAVVPHIYMAIQPGDGGRPTSVIFAIDASRDNTPSDDPAMRLTPENGLCNPQEMTRYSFPAPYSARPVVSEIEAEEGLTASDLPAFMAITVTNEMMNLGYAKDPDDTRPLNICTRKLWEQLVAAEGQRAQAAGQ